MLRANAKGFIMWIRSIRRMSAVIFASTWALVGSAAAQYPVYQDGHALDANPGIGQFRRNTASPPSFRSQPNLIVTGNVTAGRSFRAFSPIRDFSGFAFTVPSAGLSFFTRETVGIDQILRSRGAPVTPTPFFAREQTIPNAGAIVGGLTVPGFGTLPRTDVNPNLTFENLGIPPGSSVYQPLHDARTLETGTALRPDVLPNTLRSSPYLPVTESLVNPALVRSPLLATNPSLSRRIEFAVPGAIGPGGPDTYQPARLTAPYADVSGGAASLEQDDVQRRERERVGFTQASPTPARAMGDRASTGQPSPFEPIDGRIDGRAQAQTSLINGRVDFRRDRSGIFQHVDRSVSPPSRPSTVAPGAQPGALASRPPEGTFPAGTASGGDPRLGTFAIGTRGGDVFADMSRAVAGLPAPTAPAADREAFLFRATAESEEALARPLASARQAGTQAEGEYARPRPVGASAAPSVPQTAGAPTPAEASSTPGPALRELGEPAGLDPTQMLNRPIKTFVGTQDTRLNHYLRQAESFLRDGEYFRAAGQYKLASLIDPGNPLVWLGHGHALIAAGDYASAVRSLIKAITRFPEIAYFRLNLNDFVPDASLLESRRADLEARLAIEESTEVRFLLGYIEYYTGLKSYGLDNLRKAAARVPADSAIATFAALLETRQREAGSTEK